MSTVICIPDMHAPFMHIDTPNFISKCLDSFQPDEFVCLGDELDWHSVSRHTSDPNGFSPGDELREGLKQLSPIYKLLPNLKLCVSNHGARPIIRAFECGLPSTLLKTYGDFMSAPDGWIWADQWVIDDVRYTHGEEATGQYGALNLAIRQAQSQVVGHWHSEAGASYFANGKSLIFGMYSGCLIDHEKYAFAYGKKAKKKPIIGLSIIKDGTPFFQPMALNAKGRWTKKL